MSTLIGLAAIAVTIGIWIAGAIFGAGGLMARVKALETWQTGVDAIIARGGLEQRIKSLEDWRINMRQDMHEISDILRSVDTHLGRLDERIDFLIKRARGEDDARTH